MPQEMTLPVFGPSIKTFLFHAYPLAVMENHPDFGEPSTIGPGEIPVFWACGVTPQAVAMAVKPEFMITHAPGHMFVTDLLNSELSIL